MDSEVYSRHIEFEEILNFRDLGGYRAGDGRTVAWRRLFRSGELHYMTGNDAARLKEEIKLSSVIDLRTPRREREMRFGLLNQVGVAYFNMPFITTPLDRGSDEEKRLFQSISNMGEFYLYLLRQEGFGGELMRALEIIADPRNHPLVFHCNAGKDRSGVLAAIILGVLGVEDEDIVEDYILTASYIDELKKRWDIIPEMADYNDLPEYIMLALPESMELFLSALKQEYGSVRGYVEAQGAEMELFDRLEQALLI
jgi:protein-tyrosine phosphatase